MDKIWDRKSYEDGGHWPFWRAKKILKILIGADVCFNGST